MSVRACSRTLVPRDCTSTQRSGVAAYSRARYSAAGLRPALPEQTNKSVFIKSAQLLAGDRDAVQQAALAVIIVAREVTGRAVVPKRQRALPPLETAGEFRPHRVAVEIVE